jgi:RNA polymerase sigma-70 factor (ECF subfamily)
MTDDEKFLFEKIRIGDEAAFKVIYNRFAPRLYYFVYEHISHSDLVENIVQDTFMTLWDKKSKLAEDTYLGAYYFTVAKNNCLYKLRNQRYRQKLFDSADINEPELRANLVALDCLDTSVITFTEIEQIIQNTLNQLPPQCRKVFNLSRFEEKKTREMPEYHIENLYPDFRKQLSAKQKPFWLASLSMLKYAAILLFAVMIGV